jgi:predicted HD phosphohydrolase
VEPAYVETLTPGSRYTMTLQGGVMGADEASRLGAHPWLADALRLRRWDDLAKVPDTVTQPIEAWAALLHGYFGKARPA